MLHNIITSSFLSKINQAIKSGSSEIKISLWNLGELNKIVTKPCATLKSTILEFCNINI